MLVPPLAPEPLDLDILREMYRDGSPNLAGVDPRLNATRIAERLRVGRARVAGRLKAWDRSGFLVRYDVWLSPALFGWQGASLSIRVEHPRVKGELFSRLSLIDGVVSGTEFLGEWIALGLVTPDLMALGRTVALIRGLAGVREIEPPMPWRMPTPHGALSPLDLRIVGALRKRPTATLGETADRVGISTRTMTRRYAQLLDGWAIWFVPILDFRAVRVPVVALGLLLRPHAGYDPVVRRIRARYPLTLEFRQSHVGPPLPENSQVLFVMPPSAARLEELEQFVGSVEGVEAVEANVMVRTLSFPSWFDRHLDTLSRKPA
ncbi:MAG: winged helix-turn-helix transcriptional regulator [Thermoplasmata archaeon]